MSKHLLYRPPGAVSGKRYSKKQNFIFSAGDD